MFRLAVSAAASVVSIALVVALYTGQMNGMIETLGVSAFSSGMLGQHLGDELRVSKVKFANVLTPENVERYRFVAAPEEVQRITGRLGMAPMAIYTPRDVGLWRSHTDPDWWTPEEITRGTRYNGRSRNGKAALYMVYMPETQVAYLLVTHKPISSPVAIPQVEMKPFKIPTLGH